MARCFDKKRKIDMLLEKSPLQILNSGIDFPITRDNRHFSEEVYFYQ